VKQLPLNRETEAVATQILWFEPASKSLSDPVRLMAYAMAYATHEEMGVLRRYISDDDFREALDKAPAGIIDPRSWAYWNSKMGRYPAPPLPARQLESVQVMPVPTDPAEIGRNARATWRALYGPKSRVEKE
jgi:hypothetical protein